MTGNTGTSGTLRIRPAVVADFAAIAQLIQDPMEFFYVHPTGHFPWSVEQLQQLADTREELSVVERTRQVVGFADLYRIVPDESAFIGNLIIGREVRGQGAGRALIEYMTEQAVTRYRVREIRLSVFNGNTPALLLYARMQFTPYAQEERLDWRGQPVVLIHMKKPIHAGR